MSKRPEEDNGNEIRHYPRKNTNPVPMADLVNALDTIKKRYGHGGLRNRPGSKKNV